jgi:cation diffusion facilitator CzcD-associated flavoprotein CzcO
VRRHLEAIPSPFAYSLRPSPVYKGLKNNVSTRLMQTKLHTWPEGMNDFVSHEVLKQYIQEIAIRAGVERVTSYGSRVTEVKKSGHQWLLNYTTLEAQEGLQRHERVGSILCRKSIINLAQTFDAVVVASGHYHCPRIPDIPGLATWKAKWPSRIWHSKAYRKPDELKGKVSLQLVKF